MAESEPDVPNATAAAGNRAPRILVIGAGSRGNAYARAVSRSGLGQVVAVAEPIESKRAQLGRKYIWGAGGAPSEDQAFAGWREYLRWEQRRRERAANGEEVPEGVDGVFICTLDETHVEIVTALAPLRLHTLCEKPLATTLTDCVGIYRSLLEASEAHGPCIFAVGHVLRYSPHNKLLRKLLLEESAIGEIISVEWTEPVGFWHFAHSYVRGNWRRESTSAPSLLTKSCHDIDLLLWLLCSPVPGVREKPHQPSSITSTGSLAYFRRRSKPPSAGDATNCMSCDAESQCMYSAKKIYHQALLDGNSGWPVKIALPEIEQCLEQGGLEGAETALLERLAEDYGHGTADDDEHLRRPWFGRCVYEAGNDVCDDQSVTLTWEDDSGPSEPANGTGRFMIPHRHRNVKRATFHMVAFTEKICERRGRFYGTEGELEADSRTIRLHRFRERETRVYHPAVPAGGHGGGDDGLASQFLGAIDAVKNDGCSVDEAQRLHLGCSVEEIIRSHAMVFAAEEARRQKRVVDWAEWWQSEVEGHLRV